MAEVTYRHIQAGEEEALHVLVMRAFDEFVAPDLPEGGREHFNEYASPTRLGAPERQRETVVAVSEGRLVGVGRVGRRNEVPHIDLLFVEKEMHGQGVGRELVRRLLEIARESDPAAERVTVNATRYAVPFYSRLGFAPVGEEQTVGGIISTPMEVALTSMSKELDYRELARDRDALAPDGSEIRLLSETGRGSMVHCTLGPGEVSVAVAHRTVEEVWYFLEGTGQVWRKHGGEERVVDVAPGASLSIPVGAHFQFRTTGDRPLRFVIVTMPPWPGDDEAYPVAGYWERA